MFSVFCSLSLSSKYILKRLRIQTEFKLYSGIQTDFFLSSIAHVQLEIWPILSESRHIGERFKLDCQKNF